MDKLGQILFARMGITSVLCIAYMLYRHIAVLGNSKIRYLLIIRGFSGFVGVLGLYCKPCFPPMLGITADTRYH